jgi:type VI secretion system secreted protein VgrG
VVVDGVERMALSVEIVERASAAGRASVLAALDEADAAASDPAALLGLTASVRLFDAAGDERVFAGIVTGASVQRTGGLATSLGLVIEPRLAKLLRRTDTRIFQKLGVVAVATKVLEGAGYASDEIEAKVGDAPPARASFVQARETDAAFLARILAESGLSLFVSTVDGVDVVTITDGDLGPAQEATLDALSGDGLATEGPAVFDLRKERRVAPGKVTTLVHDFERPKLDPTKVAETGDGAERAMEVFHYPVRDVADAEVERAAKVRADALGSRRWRLFGGTSSLHLAPGLRFTVRGHPLAALDGEVLVLASTLTWSRREAGGVRGTFEGYPLSSPGASEVPYRPEVPAGARAPARGLVSGKVTGPPGKEIDPDVHGRVTVLPTWDRLGKADETASPKLRALQLPLGESMLTPRVGWEVLVGHWDGDADDPLVVGRMIHGAAPPTNSLPAKKAQMSLQTPTTPGGGSSNEIRFDDSAGSEDMFFNASHDMTQSTGNNATTNVTANETRDVGANREFSVSSSYEEQVTGSRTISIGGNQTVGIATYVVDDVASRSHSVGGSRTNTIGGDHKVTATGACTIDIGGTALDLVAGTVSVEPAATFTDDTSAVRVDLSAGNRVVEIAGDYSESVGAVKLLLAGGDVACEAASLNRTTTGAILVKTSGDRADSASGALTEVAAGAHVLEATNIVVKASSLLSVVMGASTITLTPGSVSIAGTNIKVDATADQLGLVLDN